ncbi:MAG TPA: MFS transporter [Herpetosiphonaceae bacterium]|nr:MFS transporter [Herpetosiphonaceae bacterium]
MQQLLGGYGRLIRNRRYFPLWLDQLVSNLGDTLHYIALVVWVFQRTGSSLVVAGAVFFEVVPVVLLAPIAGVVIDRLPRKLVLVASDIVRAILVLALLLTTEVWQIYVIIALLTSAATFFNPAVNATLPTLLDAEDLLAANSVSWSTGRFVQIIGASLAAGVITLVGAETAFVFNAATFLVSALLLLLLPVPPGRRLEGRGWHGFLTDAREGLRFARRDRFVSRLMLVQALASLSVGATSALLVVLAQRHYRLPPGGFGSFILAIGAGALLGPFLLGLLARNYHHPRWLFGPYVVRGVGDVLMAVTTSVPFAWLLLFIYGLNTSSGMVIYQTWVQRQVPDEVRGRGFTWLDVVWNVMKVISLGIGGFIAERAGVEVVYYLGGTTLVLSGLVGLVTLRAERLEQPEPARA